MVQFLPFIVLLTLHQARAKGLNLEQAYEHARAKTSRVQNAQRDVSLAELQYKQAWSTVAPTISARSINVWRDPLGGSGVQARFGEGYQHTALFNLSQPLFAGTSEYYFLNRIGKEPELAKLRKLDAENQLLFDVATQFYAIMTAGADVANQQRQQQLLQDNLRFLEGRARIGRARKADVLTTQSRLNRVRSDLITFRSRLLAAKTEFAAQIGWREGLPELEDTLAFDDQVFERSVWLQQAENNPLLKQLETQILQTRAQKNEARGGFFPTLDLDGNYYLDRAGVLSESNWDVTVTASWEIFSGGDDYRELQIQNINLQKLEAELTDYKRQLNASVGAAVAQVSSLKEELRVLKTAVDSAEKSYKQNERDRRNGLVSELEVLNSLDNLVATQSAYDRKYYGARLLYIALLRAVGRTL
jgi:outer membrane protein TolC